MDRGSKVHPAPGATGETLAASDAPVPPDGSSDALIAALAPRLATEAERAVLALAREGLAMEARVARRTHAVGLVVASPAGTITVDTVAPTPEGLVRFEGQLHSRASASLLVPPASVLAAFAIKPTRDLRVPERNIGRAVLQALGAAIDAREGAARLSKRALKTAGKNAKKARKAGKIARKLAKKAAKAAPDESKSAN